MPRMTAKRKAACVRDSHGRFKVWKGGARLKDLPKQENNFHGIATHIGKEFSRQHGRPAKVGEVVRFKTADGTFHKQAEWYVRTANGWRKTRNYGSSLPAAVKARVMRTSRPGKKA